MFTTVIFRYIWYPPKPIGLEIQEINEWGRDMAEGFIFYVHVSKVLLQF